MTERVYNDIKLSTGSYFDFGNIGSNEIHIEDIAMGLSCEARFAGQCGFYSVAQHSVLVSTLAIANRPEGVSLQHAQLLGLMHDAAEAYMGDMTSPLKRLIPEYKVIERMVHAKVMSTFGLPDEIPDYVIRADLTALALEKKHVFRVKEPWKCLVDVPVPTGYGYWLTDIWPPERAYREFLSLYDSLTEQL